MMIVVKFVVFFLTMALVWIIALLSMWAFMSGLWTMIELFASGATVNDPKRCRRKEKR